MQDTKFNDVEKRIIKWFINKDAPIHLSGFKYIVHILAKRLTDEWGEKDIMGQYIDTGKHFEVAPMNVERCMRHFVKRSGNEQTVSKYLANIFYLMKLEEE